MDLGATVCLARDPTLWRVPTSRRLPVSSARATSRLRKQGPFEGSFRQRRAETLRLVAGAAATRDDLDGEAVDALARDGLVVLAADGTVSLP